MPDPAVWANTVISAGQLVFLAGMFWRMGAITSAVRYLDARISKIEGKCK